MIEDGAHSAATECRTARDRPAKLAGETTEAWVARMNERVRLCACGCERHVVVLARHYANGIPRFLPADQLHLGRRDTTLTRWVEENRGKHFCQCGCGGVISVKRVHRATGIPRFLARHQSSGLIADEKNRAAEAWVAEQQGQHVCHCGCGQLINIVKHHRFGRIPRLTRGHKVIGAENPVYRKDRLGMARHGEVFSSTVRAIVVKRDGDKCVRCGSTRRLEVDHVVPVAEGGRAEVDNAQTLCGLCHKAKTAEERKRLAARRRLDSAQAALFRAICAAKRYSTKLEEYGPEYAPPPNL